MKKKLKAFTLIELVIVMGIFSVIMFSVLQLLEPVSNYFVRSTNFENTNACVDNIRRAIEGNLKYADRVRPFLGYDPYSVGATATDKAGSGLSSKVRDEVGQFYSDFFEGRHCTATRGTIYVMTFDNRKVVADDTWKNLSTLRSYSENEYNRGEIDLFEFSFDNHGVLNSTAAVKSQSPVVHEWYVNQKMYGNFDYCFRLLSGDMSDDASVQFRPEDFGIRIFPVEVKKAEDQKLTKVRSTTVADATFSMKNVLDKSSLRSGIAMDEKITLKSSSSVLNCSAADLSDYEVDPITGVVPRYRILQETDGGKAVGIPTPNMDDAETMDETCFFFIFTVPDKIYDEGPCTNNVIAAIPSPTPTT